MKRLFSIVSLCVIFAFISPVFAEETYIDTELDRIIIGLEEITQNEDVSISASAHVKDESGIDYDGITIHITKNNEESTSQTPRIGARKMTARTKCYLVPAGSNFVCEGYVIGRATGTGSQNQLCTDAKRFASQQAPRGCRTKHCQPCTYSY